MAFAMSLPRTKRVRHVDAGGVEVFVDDERFEFLREDGIPLQAEDHAADKEAIQVEVDQAEARRVAAIEKLQAAKWELETIMALIEQVESQDFVGIGFVGEPKKSPERLLSQRAQRLHACAQRLSEGKQRLRQGAQALKKQASRQQTFFQELGLLAQGWLLKPSSTGSADSPVCIELRCPHRTLPLAAAGRPQTPRPGESVQRTAASPGTTPDESVIVPVGRSATGHVAIAAPDASGADEPKNGLITGIEAVELELCRQQNRVFWRTLEADLMKEAQMDGRGNSSHALAKGLCAAVRPNPLPELAELGPLLGQLHLACLEGRLQGSVLERTAAWLKHCSLRAHVHACVAHELQQLQQQHPHHAGLAQIGFLWVHTEAWATSILRLFLPPPQAPLLLIIQQNSSIRLEGATQVGKLPGTRRSADGVLNLSKQEIPKLLSNILRQLCVL